MTDQNGILQFSCLQTPDPNSGYTWMIMPVPDSSSSKEDGYELPNTVLLIFIVSGSRFLVYFELNGKFSSNFDPKIVVGRALLACCLGTTCHCPKIRKSAPTCWFVICPRLLIFFSAGYSLHPGRIV